MGSGVLTDVKWYVLVVNLWAYLAVYLHKDQGWHDVARFSDAAFREVGVAISFLLIHRATTAYGMFWEARGAIGLLGHHCRMVVSKVASFATLNEKNQEELTELRERMCRRTILLFTIERLQLESRDTDEVNSVLAPFLAYEQNPDSIKTAYNVLALLADDLQQLVGYQYVAAPHSGKISENIDGCDMAVAVCDKIKGTAFPAPYEQLLDFGLICLSLILPIPFVDDWHWYIGIPVTMAVMFLFSIEFLARRLVRPFSLNAASVGVPLFDMDKMGFALQNQCWDTLKNNDRVYPVS